jgi:hypothetical protein
MTLPALWKHGAENSLVRKASIKACLWLPTSLHNDEGEDTVRDRVAGLDTSQSKEANAVLARRTSLHLGRAEGQTPQVPSSSCVPTPFVHTFLSSMSLLLSFPTFL